MKQRLAVLLFLLAVLPFWQGCGERSERPGERVLYLSGNGKITSLDPAQADDLISQYMVAAFYDTLLQYDYTARPYRLTPSMLAAMPEVSADLKHYTFRLRPDLCFQSDPCFPDPSREGRRITSHDVVFSLLRLADARVRSPVFWMLRGKIVGLDRFRELTAQAAPSDRSMYDRPCPGLEIVDPLTFRIHLNHPDPRLLYALAMPNAGIVSRRAADRYGEDLREHPVGSGPFRLDEWIRDYRITLLRNPDYRHETFPEAENPADRNRPLPLSDRIVCNLVKQPLASWLLFLQGELDLSALDKDNFDAVVGEDGKLVGALRRRDIRLIQTPQFEVTYIGFNFTDPLLGRNPDLRKAISLAYNLPQRLRHFNHRLQAAASPIPPGVAGHDAACRNPYNRYDPAAAREYLRRAGYPGGIDPATGHPLEFSFDQNGTSSQYRQLAELMIADLAAIGIRVKPVLNNGPQFFGKLRKGQFQLFRLSWVGDYPDGENFLQLFYSKNAGSCNRVFYRDPEFDRMYEKITAMPDTPERAAGYRRMVAHLAEQCPWIVEGYPVSFQLLHAWLENYRPHDFAFSRWKYLSVDPARRAAARRNFRPLELDDLRR